MGYKSKNFKGRDGKSDQSQATAYANALSYLLNAVETDELSKKDIPSEVSKDVPRKTSQKSEPQQTTGQDDVEKEEEI